jgi:RNA polymerase sigma-70 factor (ECF subfamily)
MPDMIVLIEPLIPALRRYARSLMRDRAAADDLVQDCLERAIRSWHQRREDGNAKTWIFTILHNLAINRLKQSARRGGHFALEDVQDAALARRPAQEDGLLHSEALRALDELHEDQRNVILLVSVEDLTYAETAKVLDLPVGTVMSRLARGRERLRQIIERETKSDIGPHLRRVK